MAETFTLDQLLEQFHTIGSDGYGVFTYEELKKFAEKLPGELTEEQIQTIFTHMDLDGDGKIDFYEFSQWWESKENNLLPLLYKKQAFQKKVAQLSRTVSENQKDSTSSTQIHQYSVNLQVGEAQDTTSVKLNAFSGELANQNSQAVRDTLQLNPTEVHVVFQFKVSSDLNTAKEALTNLVKQAEEFAQAILPPEVGGMYSSIVQTKVETFQENSLLLAVSSGFPMVQSVIDQQVALARQITGEEQSASVKFNLSSGLNFQTFVDNASSYVTPQLFSGLNVSVEITASEQAKESVKHIFLSLLENSSGPDKEIRGLFLSALLNGLSLNVKLANLDEIFTGFPVPTVEQFIQLVGAQANLGAIIGSLPIIQEFVDFFTNNAHSSLQVHTLVPGILAQVELNTQNFSAIFQKLLAVTPPEPVLEAVEPGQESAEPAQE